MDKDILTKELKGKIHYRKGSLNANLSQKQTANNTNTRQEPQKANSQDSELLSFVIVSDKNECEKYDFFEDEYFTEELSINGADFSELKTFFKDHNPSVDNAIGAVLNTRIENNQILCEVKFANDENSQIIKEKFLNGVLNDVSIGYRINEFVLTQRDGETHILVTDYKIVELSAVWKGADRFAKILTPQKRFFNYEIYAKKEQRRKNYE